MESRPRPIPAYRLHKASGQAIVKLDRKVHYLGKYGTEKSKLKYAAKIAEWSDPNYQPPPPGLGELTIIELCDRFLSHAAKRYRKDGRVTAEVSNYKDAMRPLLLLFGELLVKDFGPLKLEAVRELMVKGFTDRTGKPRTPLCRNVINRRIGRLKYIFRWAVGRELAPPALAQALREFEGLRKGQADCRETDPVGPVDEEDVEATLPHLPAVVADMVRVQRLTGCRPGELCSMRPVDIDRSGDPWIYRPASHKTEHHGHKRVIFIGPQAQEILRPYLEPAAATTEGAAGRIRDPESFCFSPTESEQKRREARHAARKTPLSCGNRPGTNRKAQPKRRPRDRYNERGYARAVRRACKLAGVAPLWTPNQLRHTCATRIRERYGLEASQVVLGHAKANTTEIYAERNLKLAAEVISRIG